MRAGARVVAIALSALAACFRNVGQTPPASEATKPTLVTVSDDIRRTCALSEDERDAARFRDGWWMLETAAHGGLERAARCLAEGPLKGAPVRVVVHAEGLDLAAKRADAVARFLVQLGVRRESVTEAPAAAGPGDRLVVIELANAPHDQ